MNSVELTDGQSQCGAFVAYFEDLAAPKAHHKFDQEYLDAAVFQVSVTDELVLIDENEMLNAIKYLNSGKAADELELTAEHPK